MLFFSPELSWLVENSQMIDQLSSPDIYMICLRNCMAFTFILINPIHNWLNVL